MRSLTFPCAAVVSLLSVANAQQPRIVRDLITDPADAASSNPTEFTQLGSQVVFTATTAAAGRELWTIDPVTGVASMLVDIAPGATSSNPHSFVAFGGHVYFCADDGVGGSELWRTDGTSVGTELFVDLAANGSSFPSQMTIANGLLFFAAYADGHGHELVVTDGTVAGTEVLEIAAGDAHATPSGLTATGNEVWFHVTDVDGSRDVWRSDGTALGTTLVAEQQPGSTSRPGNFHPLANGNVVFTDNGEVWLSDGTPTGTTSIATSSIVATIGNTIFFANGVQLSATDGTPGNAAVTASLPLFYGQITGLTVVNNRILIHAIENFFTNVPATFSVDSTGAGPIQLPQHVPAGAIISDGTTAWFGVTDGGEALWQTDATVAGTTLALTIANGVANGVPFDLALLSSPTRVMFTAADTFGREPWIYDPLGASGQRLADLTSDNGATGHANPDEFVDAAGTLYLRATTGPFPETRLWRSDGSELGTEEVTPLGLNLPPGPRDLVTVGATLYFRTYDATNEYRLWVSDGSEAGTVPLDLGTNTYPRDLFVAEDLLYFQCDDQFQRTNLWRTDGTQAGTYQIVARPEWGSFGEMAPLGRGIVFAYQTYAEGQEPYFNDGTTPGAVPLGDLDAGSNSSGPRYIQNLGDRCFFTIYDDRLMVTDGTVAGTSEPLAGMPDMPTDIRNLFGTRDRLYFTGTTAANNVGLYVTDGTLANTVLIEELLPAPQYNVVGFFHVFGDGLLFRLYDGTRHSLWHVDGTSLTATRLTYEAVGHLVVTGEREAWFQGFDPAHGQELWRTDGTIAGTRQYADLFPGPTSSSPRDLTFSGGRVMFRAQHPQLGVEPWAVDLHATSQEVGYGCTPFTSIAPRMWCDDPVRGTTAMIDVAQGPEGGLALALISYYTTDVHPLGTGVCDYFVDAGLAILGFAVTPGGVGSIPLAVPDSPMLQGAQLRLQGLMLPLSGILEAELSNGVTLTVGH